MPRKTPMEPPPCTARRSSNQGAETRVIGPLTLTFALNAGRLGCVKSGRISFIIEASWEDFGKSVSAHAVGTEEVSFSTTSPSNPATSAS